MPIARPTVPAIFFSITRKILPEHSACVCPIGRLGFAAMGIILSVVDAIVLLLLIGLISRSVSKGLSRNLGSMLLSLRCGIRDHFCSGFLHCICRIFREYAGSDNLVLGPPTDGIRCPHLLGEWSRRLKDPAASITTPRRSINNSANSSSL